MSKQAWFDPQSNEILFSKYLGTMDSWQQALADGKVEPAEVAAQAERVAALLRALEPKLSDALHVELTTVFYELAVLYGMERLADVAEAE